MVDALPAGAIPYSQSGEGSFNIASGKSLASFNDSIGRIPQSMRNIKSLRNLLASSGEQFVGPTVMNSFMRSMATSFGVDFGGDLDDLTEAKRALKDMMVESAQRLKGQGQITENERKMLADSLANIETLTPKALIKALDILEKGMKNTMAKADAWANSGLRPNQWYEWSTNWDLKRAQREFKNASDILDEI